MSEQHEMEAAQLENARMVHCQWLEHEIERLRSENLALREALENINRIYLRLWVDTKLEKSADGSNRAD